LTSRSAVANGTDAIITPPDDSAPYFTVQKSLWPYSRIGPASVRSLGAFVCEHLEIEAHQRGVVGDVLTAPGPELEVLGTPIFQVGEALPLSIRELPRHLGEGCRLGRRDFDRCEWLQIVVHEH